ncbi:MAG: beta-galactosidase [Promethearchaeota archaeon]
MEKRTKQSGKISFNIGQLCTIVGTVLIYAQILIQLLIQLYHATYDVVPSELNINEDQSLYLIVIPALGLPSIMVLLFSSYILSKTRRVRPWVPLIAIFFFPSTLTTNASLLFGGGWYVGTIASDIGLCLQLASTVFFTKNVTRMPGNLRKHWKKHEVKAAKLYTLAIVLVSFIISFITPIFKIPAPLVATASSKPSGITPEHANTFYILPIWEADVTNDSTGLAQMQYLVDQVGGVDYTGTGFIRVGRSLSCWYTNDLDGNGWYDPTRLYRALNLSATSNTPILFHMNGGNWGQSSSIHPNISAMRNNVSNCQWDQNNVCHPIKNNLGPNDRFWSFWPGSDWEKFREFNIKRALAIIHDFWQAYPDLLVGFSTDSEYHLNYKDFKEINVAINDYPDNYSSYFDYNNGTIQQFRDWAQANYSSLADFNHACGTNFGSWPEVDAPRARGIVGKKGNPWWETWTDFRIWSVKEASARQCRYINESGFPRDMIWNHQILSPPGDETARYRRCDPLETAVNQYSRVGVTRYDWISPQIWHSLGKLALHDGSGDTIPSWGIFEWNLWHQHEYWAYREMLNCIYQYGGHVICPNEWANASINEGLWIPGEDPSDVGPDSECTGTNSTCFCYDPGDGVVCYKRHGNPHFIKALQDFITKGQDYERGTSPELRVHKLEITMYNQQYISWDFFGGAPGVYWMAAAWFACIAWFFVMVGVANDKETMKIRRMKRRERRAKFKEKRRGTS